MITKSIKSIKSIKGIKGKVKKALDTLDTLRSGFTLIELIIYGGMLAILLGVFTTIFGMIIDAQLESDATSSVQQDASFLLTKLSKDIMTAESVASPSGLGQQLTTLQLTNNSITYTYSINGSGNLIVTTSSGSTPLNSYRTSVSGLQFQRRGNTGGKNSIQFNYTVTSRTLQGDRYESTAISSSATLR